MQSTFVGLTLDEVQILRAQDLILAAISAQGMSLSFDWLRQRAKRDWGIWESLLSGRSIPESVQQLDQYLYSYGLMVSDQWRKFCASLSFTPDPSGDTISLIDYGCGQGLAGLRLHDCFGTAFMARVSRISLIEPSAVALVRAEAVYRAIAPNAEIVCINKSFDEIISKDLDDEFRRDRIHIFSNVVDILGFDHVRLFAQGLSTGGHVVLAVGNDRNEHGGTRRLLDLEALFSHPDIQAFFSEVSSEMNTFKCGDGDKFSAVSWLAKFEVIDV